MSKHAIGRSRNGIEVYAQLTQNPLATSIARNPRLLHLVATAIASLDLTDQDMTISHDMGRSIGYSDILETREKDTVFYAQTSKLPVYTRFVKQRSAEQTSIMTMQLQLDTDGCYRLTNVWIGKEYPPLPSTDATTTQSMEYWSKHAVVFNGQAILSSTITKTCPY